MNEFERCYNACMGSLQPSAQIYAAAYKLIASDCKLGTKEEVLYKMLYLFPNDVELYYRFGKLYKSINPMQAITWHKIGFSLNPKHAENTVELCSLLYNNMLGHHVLDLNKDNKLDIFMDNPAFLAVYARCNFQNLRYENGVNYLLKLIEFNSVKRASSYDEKFAKWQNYHDLGYVYSKLGQPENSILYAEKSTELALKFDLPLPNKLLSFSNYLVFHSYIYANNPLLYTHYLKINSYFIDKQSFDLVGRKRNDKIRVGYVSSDFTYHPIANFLLPILMNHTKERFEIFLFSNNAIAEIFFVTKNRFMIDNLNDYDAAALIYAQNIDILIDLNGHTVSNRLGIFAHNPAPVQITYLGFPNTTGLKSIKYRITDRITNPETSTELYSEKLVFLPKCFLLYKSLSTFVCEPNLVLGGRQVILGAINKENKNSGPLLMVWRRILQECKNTQLVIKLETYDNKTERMRFYMERLQTTGDRIVLLNRLNDSEYDKVFSKIDILLDTFPYCGTTTTCNALSNSVPVVTLYNANYHCHCVSSSILINAGLPELVANTETEYIDIVKRMVNDTEIINTYKNTIGAKFRALMDPRKFMDSYEAALTGLCA